MLLLHLSPPTGFHWIPLDEYKKGRRSNYDLTPSSGEIRHKSEGLTRSRPRNAACQSRRPFSAANRGCLLAESPRRRLCVSSIRAFAKRTAFDEITSASDRNGSYHAAVVRVVLLRCVLSYSVSDVEIRAGTTDFIEEVRPSTEIKRLLLLLFVLLLQVFAQILCGRVESMLIEPDAKQRTS